MAGAEGEHGWSQQRGDGAGHEPEPTLMFSSPPPPSPHHQLLRKRHIGNDIVTIIFQEPGALPFTPKNIRSHFQHVFIIVRAHNPCTDNVCYRYTPRPRHAQEVRKAGFQHPGSVGVGEGGHGWPRQAAFHVSCRCFSRELYSLVPTPPERVVLNQKGACHPSFDKETIRNLFLPGVFWLQVTEHPPQKGSHRASLAIQWLRLCASSAGGTGSIPGRGTRIPHASWCTKRT